MFLDVDPGPVSPCDSRVPHEWARLGDPAGMGSVPVRMRDREPWDRRVECRESLVAPRATRARIVGRGWPARLYHGSLMDS